MTEQPLLRFLSNGMAVQLETVPDLSAAAVCLRAEAGSHHEPDRWPGLAHLLEHLLFQDSRCFRGSQRLMPWLSAQNGRVNATTEACRTLFYFDTGRGADPDVLSGGIARLLDMVCSPQLDPAAVSRETEVIDAEYGMLSRHVPTLIEALLAQDIQSPPGYRRFVAGNRQSLSGEPQALSEALSHFHRCYYRPDNLCLLIRAPLPAQDLCCLLAQALSSIGQTTQLPAGAEGSLPVVAEYPLPESSVGEAVLLHAPGEVQHCLSYRIADPQGVLLASVPLLRALAGDTAPGSLADYWRSQGLCRDISVRVLSAAPGCLWLLLCVTRPPGQQFPPGVLTAAWQQWLQQCCTLNPSQLAHYQQLAEQAFRQLNPMEQIRAMAAGQYGRTPQLADLAAALLRQSPRELQTATLDKGRPEMLRGFPCRWQALPASGVTSPLPAHPFIFYPATAPLAEMTLTRASAEPLLCHRQRCDGDMVSILMRPLAGTTLSAGQFNALKYQLSPVLSRVRHAGGKGELTLRQGVPWLTIQLPDSQQATEITDLLCTLWPETLAVPAEDNPQDIVIRRLLAQLPEMLATQENTPRWCCLIACRDDALFSALRLRLEQVLPLQKNAEFAADCVPQPQQRHLADNDSDNALLFFLPVTPQDAADGRALAALCQPLFYHWLREELSVGYVVSCRFEALADRQGILLALQSPRYDCRQLTAWCRQFFSRISEQVTALRALPPLAAETDKDPLMVLCAQLWQAMTGQAVMSGCRESSVSGMQQLQRRWCESTAGAICLSYGRWQD